MTNRALAIYLAVVQFFFATTWTLYVIYLPALAEQAGIDHYWIPWILVADQVVFVVMDVATGFWIDRVRGTLKRFGGWILGLTVVSSIAFLVLPFFNVNAAVVLLAVFVWAVTSSALRSPPWALLAKYAATPTLPWLSALVLTGSALAAASAPYLGMVLKGTDPRLPFVISTVTLLAAVWGLVLAERRIGLSAPAGEAEPPSRLELPRAAVFFLALLVMAIGFQVHFSLNSAPQYLRFAGKDDLPYLLPVFWIGFNVMMFPAAAAAKRMGALNMMAIAALLGAVAIVAAEAAPSIHALIAAQFFSGGCWGAASVAMYTAAVHFGRTGREGRFLGTLFAVLAVAAFVRIGAYASDIILEPGWKEVLPWIPQVAWVLAAVLLLLAARPLRAAPSGQPA